MLKIRCSSLGKIMTGTIGLTDAQQKELDGYYKRTKPLTDRMKARKAELEDKRDNIELSTTTLSYLAELEVEQRTGRSREIYTSAMEKGTLQEDQAIELLCQYTGEFYLKNEEPYENKWITGTPDIVHDIVRDTKCSWNLFTFPHEWSYTLNKDYYWQLQGYMDLTGLEKASLDYVLVNTPDHIIEKEKSKIMWMDPADYDQAVEKIYLMHTFDDIPLEERIFSVEVERNDEDIKAIHKRVEMCREVWEQKVKVAA